MLKAPSKGSSRNIYTVSLVNLSSTPAKAMAMPNDLPILLLHLRIHLQSQPPKNAQIDETISQYVDAIVNKLEEMSRSVEPMEMFDTVQSTLKVYMNDFLTIEKCLAIFCDESFRRIFDTLMYIDSTMDFSTLFSDQPLYARTVCYRSFDLLSLDLMQKFLTDKSPVELFTQLATILSVLLTRIQLTVEYVTFKKNDLQSQVPILRLLLEYVDRKATTADSSSTSDILDQILNFFWAISNETILVPNLLEAFCQNFVLKWISSGDISLNIYRPCISILHNLARHERAVRSLNEAKGIETLKEFKARVLDRNKTRSDDTFVEMRLLYCMALSLLTEPKETREDLNELKPVLDQLMELAINAGQSPNDKYNGFHVSEVIVVLTKLCVHDEILKYVLNESACRGLQSGTRLEFFCDLLIKFRGALAGDNEIDQLTLLALFNILWSVSFHEEYSNQLRSDTKLLMTVKSLAIDEGDTMVEQYVPRHMSSIPKAANGILWNLDEDNPAHAARTAAEPVEASIGGPVAAAKQDNRVQVMISYCHADSTFCHQLVDSLKKDTRLSIWVDFLFCHTEDFWEEIAEAIENAHVVLFLMSKDYQNSKSCRQEVMYAKDSLKKRFIPIFIQKDFTATGWLGVRIVGPQYIRFGKRSFEETVKELNKLIFEDKTGSSSERNPTDKPEPSSKPVDPPTEPTKPVDTSHPSTNKPDVPTVSAPTKPVEQWIDQDIAQWFAANHLQKELCNLYQFKHGSELLLYSQCFRSDWQMEYNEVRERYQRKYNSTLYRDEFVRFVSALNLLSSRPSTSLEKKSRSCCLS